MFEIFNQAEGANMRTQASINEHSVELEQTPDLTPQSVAHMIRTDFNRWYRLLCANQNSALFVSPHEVAQITFDAIAGHCLPRVDLHTQSSKSELLHSYLSESLYVLEQPFLEQVKYLASATRVGAAGGQMPTVRILEAF